MAMKCEYENNPNCQCGGNVEVRHSMTAYHFEGIRNSPEDPNRDFYACDNCYEEYRSFWKEQWDEYYGMVYEGIAGSQARNENRYLDDECSSPQDQFEDFASRIRFT